MPDRAKCQRTGQLRDGRHPLWSRGSSLAEPGCKHSFPGPRSLHAQPLPCAVRDSGEAGPGLRMLTPNPAPSVRISRESLDGYAGPTVHLRSGFDVSLWTQLLVRQSTPLIASTPSGPGQVAGAGLRWVKGCEATPAITPAEGASLSVWHVRHRSGGRVCSTGRPQIVQVRGWGQWALS